MMTASFNFAILSLPKDTSTNSTMEPARWSELATMYEQVLELPDSSREEFLLQIKQKDEYVWNELVSLLQFTQNETHAASSANQSGDTFDLVNSEVGRYQVLEVLGRGGMGVVYKAKDLELERHVALKFLPPLLNQDAGARERFYIEARAASALDHTNICYIYEIGHSPKGQVFIAMGYYDGRTLDKRLSHGPLPNDEFLEYAAQVGEGLAMAHHHNIIHRDVKPGNVMVTEDGVVKILDFGLAKLTDQNLTKTGMMMGTVAYMSPELIQGGEAGPATDIWSYGVMLYEMASGKKPFSGPIPETVMYKVISEEPAFEHDLPDTLPEPVKNIIKRCLRKKVGERYASMDEVLLDLNKVRGLRTDEASLHIKQTPLSRYRLAGSLSLLVLVAALAWFFVSRSAAFGDGNEKIIAVLPFTSVSGSSEEDQVLSEGLMQMIAGMLEELDSPEHPLTVIPISDMHTNQVTTAEKARDLFGVTVVIEGELSRLRDVIALSVSLKDPRDNRFIGDNMTLLDRGESFENVGSTFQEEILAEMASMLEIPLSLGARKSYLTLQTSDTDAYSYYLQGLGYLNRFYQPNALDYAIQQFGKSIERDSMFALSHSSLCEAHLWKYRFSLDSKDAEKGKASCDKAAELAGDQPAVLISVGQSLVQTGSIDEGVSNLRKALEYVPENAQAHYWLAQAQIRMGSFDSAIVYLEEAIDLKPDYWLYYVILGGLYGEIGMYDEAVTRIEIALDLTPDNYMARANLGIVKLLQGHPYEAEQLLGEALASHPEDSQSGRWLGIIQVLEGKYEEAINSLAYPTEIGDILAIDYLAQAYDGLGDKATADSLWRDLVQKAESTLSVDSANASIQVILANAYASLGDFESSHALLENTNDASIVHLASYLVSRIYEKSNDREKALVYLRRALEHNFTVYIIDQDPWLEELRESPEYQELRDQYTKTQTDIPT